jgi:murein DD-endopeptidase MepM/ murein hydrolase activator NlpD
VARICLQIALLLIPMSALGAEPSVDETALFDRLGVREQTLDAQTTAAENTARQRALLAYRLSRRRELDFAANPEDRLDDARSFDLALVALRRGLDESRTLARELDRVRVERSALEVALIARALNDNNDNKNDSVASTGPDPGSARLLRPVRGTPVAVPGARRDGPTKIEIRHDSVEFLARLNDPVHAIAAGVVKRVEPMAQGGFAVMTAHSGGLTSILTGLRDVAVKPGDEVLAGQTLGLTGRNLDGAAVISVAIWRHRRAQDAGKLLHVRLTPTS